MRERNKVIAVAAETGIAVMPPDAWLDSGAALQGAEMAREAGCFAAYHEAVFRAAFEERLDIGDIGRARRSGGAGGNRSRALFR